MSVRKVERTEYTPMSDVKEGTRWDGLIEITFRDRWTPCLVGTVYSDKVLLVYKCNTESHERAAIAFGVETVDIEGFEKERLNKKIKVWYELDLMTAMAEIMDMVV